MAKHFAHVESASSAHAGVVDNGGGADARGRREHEPAIGDAAVDARSGRAAVGARVGCAAAGMRADDAVGAWDDTVARGARDGGDASATRIDGLDAVPLPQNSRRRNGVAVAVICVSLLVCVAALAIVLRAGASQGANDEVASSSAETLGLVMDAAAAGEGSDASGGTTSEGVAQTEDAVEEDASPTADELRAALDLAEVYDDSLAHGVKTVEYQRYIVLHDTEGGGTPEDVVSYWVGNGSGVAAHFVVGKDGHIAQCVPLDQIAHHAGFGDTGHNALFGVEDESRDDKVGTTSIGSAYADYGMNSYSIGIEMVHMGGEGDYPEAQLAAVDALIAYIDAYYAEQGAGEPSAIIDHKDWRSGNSDTSAEFAGCLANYQDHRTHLAG